jgi:hypothetical protein
LTSPIGASIGYRLHPEQPWQLYTQPIAAESFEAKSVRYGWAESQTTNFSSAKSSAEEKP